MRATGLPRRAVARLVSALAVMVGVVGVVAVAMGMISAAPAFAETHPFLGSFGSFSDPNGIAVDEATGDVYVASIGPGEEQTR